MLSIGGHTYLDSFNGSDTVKVSNAVQTLQSMRGLLTVAADVPQAVMTELSQGSPGGVSLGVGTLGTVQLQILASGGTFGLSFNGGAATSDLSAASLTLAGDIQSALSGLASVQAFIPSGSVTVTKLGTIYRIEFLDFRATRCCRSTRTATRCCSRSTTA